MMRNENIDTGNSRRNLFTKNVNAIFHAEDLVENTVTRARGSRKKNEPVMNLLYPPACNRCV